MSQPAPLKKQQRRKRGVLTREHTTALVLVVATVLVFYLTYLLIKPFSPALIWAVALAVVAHPMHHRIERRVRKPNIAAGLSVTVVALLIILPTIFVVQQVIREATGVAQEVQDFLQSDQWRTYVDRYPQLSQMVSWAEQSGGVERLQDVVLGLAGNMSSLVSGSVWGLIQLLIALFALYYFFRDRGLALASLRQLSPLTERETTYLFRRLNDTIYATIYGTVVVAILQGALGGLMFWWLGLPAPLLWGVVMALLALIPYLGAFVVWGPAAVLLASQGSWVKAALLTSWGTIVVGLIDNLVYPILVGNRLRMHTLAAFIAIVGGITVFGMSGIVLGPVIVALAFALMEVWRTRTAGGKAAETAVAPQS